MEHKKHDAPTKGRNLHHAPPAGVHMGSMFSRNNSDQNASDLDTSVLNFNLINSGGNICMSPRMNCSGFGLTFALRLRFLFFCLRLQLLTFCSCFLSLAFSASVGGALTHRASAARNSIQHTMCVLKGPKATKLHPKAFAFAHTQRQLIWCLEIFSYYLLLFDTSVPGFLAPFNQTRSCLAQRTSKSI